MVPAPGGSTDPTIARLRRQSGQLSTAALQRIEERLPWYREMPPDDRSWVGLVAQAGIAAFVSWFADRGEVSAITSDIFGTAPRELTRSVSLRQTLDLLRVVVDAVEEHAARLAAPGDEALVRDAVLRYSREVAFAAAEVYASAAEVRGAWDARLEALVVDALLRGEADDALRSRAAALGWVDDEQVTVLVGTTPGTSPGGPLGGPAGGPAGAVVDDLRRLARSAGADALIGVQGNRVVVVVGRVRDPLAAAAVLTPAFGPGPVVTGPVVPGLHEAGRSARAALAGVTAARAWPSAPRPVAADDLLPERLLTGDLTARRALVDRAYRRLLVQDAPLLETVATYLELGRSLEGTARALFVHPNTVRYRLRRVAEITGWDATDPREGFVLQMSIAAGRLADTGGGTAR